MQTILIAEKTTPEVRRQLLEAAGGEAELIFAETQAVTRQQVLQADALIGNVDPVLLEDAPRLKWVQLMSSGADAYAGHAPLRDAFTLTSATGAYGVGIAEYMVCMLLVMMKKIPAYYEQQKSGVWRDADGHSRFVRIRFFAPGDTEARTLYYLSTDISNKKFFVILRKHLSNFRLRLSLNVAPIYIIEKIHSFKPWQPIIIFLKYYIGCIYSSA